MLMRRQISESLPYRCKAEQKNLPKTKLWVIGPCAENKLPANKAQSFLRADGRIANLQTSAKQLEAMGYATE